MSLRSEAPISTIGRQSTPIFDAFYSADFGKTPGSSRPAKRYRACAIFSRPLTAVAITSTMVELEMATRLQLLEAFVAQWTSSLERPPYGQKTEPVTGHHAASRW